MELRSEQSAKLHAKKYRRWLAEFEEKEREMIKKTQTEGWIDVIKTTSPVDANEQQFTDTEILDWLEKQKTGYGDGIVFRMSSIGRGFRLHEIGKHKDIITENEPQPTVRKAIELAMNAERKDND